MSSLVFQKSYYKHIHYSTLYLSNSILAAQNTLFTVTITITGIVKPHWQYIAMEQV